MSSSLNLRLFSVLLLVASFGAYAKTPAQLKAEFAALLGPGKFARIVWSKGGSNATSEQIYTYGSTPTKIMALDTKDGIIRQLVPNQPSGHMINASLTWDGNRVVYYNNTAEQVLIADWGNGANARVLLNGCRSERCWEAADGSDWFTGQIGNILYRINVDTTSRRVVLYNGMTHYADLSPDGNYLAACFPDYPNVGLYNIKKGGSPLLFNPGGCWPNISRNNAHQAMHTIEPHTNFRIVDSTGKELLNQHVGTELLPSTLQYREYNALRWTNDPDIISFWIDGGSKVNPIVQRVSTRRWVAINDSVTNINEGNADVWVYTETSGVAGPRARAVPRRTVDASFVSRAFDSQGRAASGRAPGVYATMKAGDDIAATRAASVRK